MPLSTELGIFRSAYAQKIYVAFSTHIILNLPTIRILTRGLSATIAAAITDSII